MPNDVADDLARSFRAAMRKLAATVTVVTTRDADGDHGMAATAVTSLSTSPPSLLVCVNRSASMHEPLRLSGRFCVNLLGTQHAALVHAFGGGLEGAARFGVGAWRHDGDGVGYLADAAAILFCTLEQSHAYGTHTIFIGQVDEARIADGIASMLWGEGGAGRFSEL